MAFPQDSCHLGPALPTGWERAGLLPLRPPPLCCAKLADPEAEFLTPSHTSSGSSPTKAQRPSGDRSGMGQPGTVALASRRGQRAESDVSWGLLTPSLSLNLALSSRWGRVSRHTFT